VVIGFLVAYFLTFTCGRALARRTAVACTIPFFTSNMIA